MTFVIPANKKRENGLHHSLINKGEDGLLKLPDSFLQFVLVFQEPRVPYPVFMFFIQRNILDHSSQRSFMVFNFQLKLVQVVTGESYQFSFQVGETRGWKKDMRRV